MTQDMNQTEHAKQILISFGLPRAQHNERSALCLLALLNLTPGKTWAQAGNPLMGITPIMDWARDGKMPDVVLYCPARNWLLLVESVTSHGPVDGKRHNELARLFASSSAGLVYVTAFPSRALMTRYLSEIAWETEVWVADAPSHLIHFNGSRFLGPYDARSARSTP